jgi:hypothetical protein
MDRETILTSLRERIVAFATLRVSKDHAEDLAQDVLAVLHTVDEARISEILGQLSSNGLPNLFMPPRGNFVKVDALPVLGTGKMDLRALKRIAMERLSPQT